MILSYILGLREGAEHRCIVCKLVNKSDWRGERKQIDKLLCFSEFVS